MQKEIAQAAQELSTAAENFCTACKNLEQATTPQGGEKIPANICNNLAAIYGTLENTLNFLFDVDFQLSENSRAEQVAQGKNILYNLPAPVRNRIIDYKDNFLCGWVNCTDFRFLLFKELSEQGATTTQTLRAVYCYLINNCK